MKTQSFRGRCPSPALALDKALQSATSEAELQQLQQILLDWHGNALAKEISFSVARTAQGIRERTLLGSPIGNQKS